MTPEEKSKELIEKYKSIYVTVDGCKDGGNPCIITNNMFTNAAARCAKIAVEEMINDCDASSPFETTRLAYWNEVLTHLNT
jgi:hypothetical protein